MTFAHPQFLWLLALPVTFLFAAGFLRARAATAAPHPKIPRASIGRSALKIGPWSLAPRPLSACAALACLILALARPQGATLATPSVIQARDVLVAVDVSRSMLADDVAPSRLGRAQLLVRNLADELRGERLGLLPFAGTAFLQSPLSADYEIFRTFLDELGPDMIPAGGSNFAALLRTADEAFGPADSNAPGTSARPDRFLLVLSDGEAEDDSWRPLADKLAGRGVRILALGLGTSAGAMVPDGKGGLTKDERGAAVLSRLNPATLQDLARLTDGAYRDASAWVDLPALLRETVARGRASLVTTDSAPRRQELFAWFLAPALTLLFLALVREFPPVPRVSTKPLRPAPGFAARLVPLALAIYCSAGLVQRAFAADAPPAPPADPLVELVGRLAAAPDLAASDLARLATLTAERGEQSRQPSSAPATPAASSVPEGAIRDALSAVSAGQAADPRATDWPALRKRLEALLAPPPQQPPQKQPQQNQSQPNEQKPQPDKQEPQSSEQSPSKDSSASSNPENTQPNDSSSSGSPSDPKQQDTSPAGGAPKSDPAASKPLGDLAKSNPEKSDSESASPKPAPSEKEPPADEPAQQAGGVSASGQPSDAQPGADTAQLDPQLVVPQQRLERVRDSDAPARLFQLLQESENPPEARERRGAGTKQTW